MIFPEVVGIIAVTLQFIVAGYALRLNRIFGTARVGWSLFWAFTLLALIHMTQSVAPFNTGIEIEVIYALISLLLLTGMVHIETLLKERLVVEQEEERLCGRLESQVKEKTAHLTLAIEKLQSEIVERKRAGETLRHTQRALETISNCNQTLVRAATEPALLREVCRVIVVEGGYRFAWVGFAKHDEQKTVHPAAHAGHNEGYLESANITWADTERGRGPVGTAIRTGQVTVCRDILADPGFAPWRDEAIKRRYASTLMLPLLEDDKVFGVLNIYATEPDAFDAGEVKLLTELGDDLAYGILALRARAAHQKTEERVLEQARLLDLAPDAILVRDLEDRILYWNKSAEEIYGWTAAEAVGRNLDQLLHKEVSESLKFAKARKTVMEKGDWQGEFIAQTKNGREVIAETSWTLVCDSQGNPKSILGISTDVTEKKKLEAQFLRSQRMEGLGTLASGIAHDLNNVLTPLLISVRVLNEKVADEEGRELLRDLEANVQRGAGLVKQVLAFGRGVAGERIAVNPKNLAHEIKQIVNETFPKSVEFDFHCSADLWSITGDPTQIYQVLLNLCVNARDAMPQGGKLFLHMENVTLDEAGAGMSPGAQPGPYVLIKVKDAGLGIPKEIQDRIFDPFFTTKAPGKGSGLGLSTTLAIVKSHHGFINCYSEPGQGTLFKVYLPANPAATVMEIKAAAEFNLPRGHNELVLVIDDEDMIRKIAQKMLERFGYRVLLAADGIEAIAIFKSRPGEIDVVVTDMVMPKMEGPATVKALRAINPEIKIIGSSGLASTDGMAKIKGAGIRHFISKPYTTDTLLKTLREALQNHQS